MGLFKPAWMSKNIDKAVNAVEKLTNENTLIQAAKESICAEARVAAAKKLAGIVKKLLEIMESCEKPYQWDIGYAAFEKLKKIKGNCDPHVAIAMYEMIRQLYGYGDDRYAGYIAEYITPVISVPFLTYCFKKGISSTDKKTGIGPLIFSIKRNMVVEACAELDERLKRQYYHEFGIVDGILYKTECEVGRHDYEVTDRHWHLRDRDDSYGVDVHMEIIKCRKCGYQREKMVGEPY